MATKQVQLSLTESMVKDVRDVQAHMRGEKTFDQVLIECLEDGVASKLYRYNRNKKVYAQSKDDKALLEQLKAQLKAGKLIVAPETVETDSE